MGNILDLYMFILGIIHYNLQIRKYGEVSEEQIAAGVQLLIISFIPVINVILVVFFIIGLFIKIMIVIEDIFDKDNSNL